MYAAPVHQEHFVAENFKDDKTLKPGAHPSLFDGGKKKVILRPSAASAAAKTPAPRGREY